MTELTGWKPIPQEFCDSNCLADANAFFRHYLVEHRRRAMDLCRMPSRCDMVKRQTGNRVGDFTTLRALSRRLALKIMGVGSPILGVGRSTRAVQSLADEPTIVGPPRLDEINMPHENLPAHDLPTTDDNIVS
ncbi:MAG: hypothetical protein H6823_05310 [Planctomycetaceae bacterium]|nr:hypothetical protein [Planctomycetaceae bacterium]